MNLAVDELGKSPAEVATEFLRESHLQSSQPSP